MKLEDHPSDDRVFDPGADVTEPRRPTPLEREVLDLLGVDVPHHTWVRLSVDRWEQVDRVAEALHEARSGIPAPRPGGDR